jgi:hypothetical protein
MSQKDRQVKNLKISVDVHEVLKSYCDKNGIKIYRFLENLILETCSNVNTPKQIPTKKQEIKDIYGED